ncbi:hypothetical protein GCM10020331_000850 [Ectobacillus funiculus]
MYFYLYPFFYPYYFLSYCFVPDFELLVVLLPVAVALVVLAVLLPVAVALVLVLVLVVQRQDSLQ